MDNKITLDDLLATESEVLNRIARDLEELDFTDTNMANHSSTTSGHSSSGRHISHTSGVSSAIPLHKISDQCEESK